MVPKTFEEAFEQVTKLVERFAENEQAYLAPKYQEAEARNDFINPFFVALGWDVYHHEHPNPYEREVRIEKSVMVGDRGKRADYAFFTKPDFLQPKFLAEAKKPARQLENADDCFQAIRYGWNSNTPLAVLTDFEQFLILDSRYKPSITNSMRSIIEHFHYKQFADPEEFRKIYFLFSRESVGNDSIEKFIAARKKAKAPRGAKIIPAAVPEPVGDTFLNELDEHREELARAFKRASENLTGEDLTEITQRALDRLVFMRFLEDKLVEPSEMIDRFAKSSQPWRMFAAEMPRLNKIYNGIIFKPHSVLDNASFIPAGDAFEKTVGWLSHRNSAYDFNTIPIHILGSIYERFLGKTITVTDKRASVEEKPEVRKAGGVYYTPEYIVTYIVENTIGKLIDGKKPDEIAEMHFADIACGSGSFLLGIFDHLIKYHVKWYGANKTRRDDAIRSNKARETADGNLQLTLEHKRDILTNNIYGVDLDPQAVEVAQLSLYLKLLEEETAATVQPKLGGLQEQLLPSLSKNIVHGNSLIDYDITGNGLFDDLYRKLDPMNFESAFPRSFEKGGFDAIVGNPPYGAQLDEVGIVYLRRKFPTGTKDLDSYVLFMEQAVRKTRIHGKMSMIVPSGWYSGPKFSSLRRFMACNTNPDLFVNLPYDIFDAWVDTTIFAVTKRAEPVSWPRTDEAPVSLRTFPKRQRISSEREFYDDLETANFTGWFSGGTDEYLTYADTGTTALIQRIQLFGRPLSEVADVQRGVTPFVLTEEPPPAASRRAFSGTVRRYVLRDTDHKYIRFDETLAEFKPERYFLGPRLLLRELISRQFRLQAVKAIEDFVTNKSMQTILAVEGGPDLNYLLGILNSRLMSWYFLHRSNIAQRDDFPKIVLKETRLLPFAIVDRSDKEQLARHDRLVGLVEQLLGATQQLETAVTDRDRESATRLCEYLDGQIDDLVYEIYEITSDERQIIEAK